MDLFVQYELDETFNESIKSRYRDEFSYDSFSEGEKARIDLAILFTFRAISKMKSTSATNLLLLDETFDGSIDADGSDSISAILRTLTDTHVFCISHNEKMFDKFHSLIKFEKIQNYSVMC
jgi:DNA repair exonuclease SbcCD ATPase subunit